MNDTFETAKKNIITYFKGVRTEFGKITWPEKNQVVVETFFVVAIVFIFTVFIYVVDISDNQYLLSSKKSSLLSFNFVNLLDNCFKHKGFPFESL